MSKIEVVKGDITLEDVDAIVNAANETLMGGGGVDGAIHRRAGPALLRECKTLPVIEPGVRCRVGEAKITIGCALRARYVIHTVAPRFVGSSSSGPLKQIYKYAKEGLPEDLASCYRECILLAESQGLKSIAFPSLGTGAFGWPVEEAAAIAMAAIKGAMKEAPGIELVRMVCFSDEDKALYEAAKGS